MNDSTFEFLKSISNGIDAVVTVLVVLVFIIGYLVYRSHEYNAELLKTASDLYAKIDLILSRTDKACGDCVQWEDNVTGIYLQPGNDYIVMYTNNNHSDQQGLKTIATLTSRVSKISGRPIWQDQSGRFLHHVIKFTPIP